MSEQCEMHFSRPTDDMLLIRLGGSWTIGNVIPSADEVRKQLESSPKVKRISFDTNELKAWDSGLLTFLVKVIKHCSTLGMDIDREGLPQGVKRLLALASAVPEKKDVGKETGRESFLSRIGENTIDLFRSAVELLGFIGDAFLSLIKMFQGKASFRRSDLTLIIQECGASALPVVTLISVLIGMILAFVGAHQLAMFGAQIYVANAVAVGMVREMGAIMTGIIMAGRTGAAFAAQLGTMQVNEEIDALKTLGVSPMEFLVLPRMLALSLMMPLLCIFSIFLGILGGTLVAVGMFDLSLMEYYNQTKEAVGFIDFSVGIFKSSVFGALVALSGCLRGMQCGRDAAAVGIAATSAVVTGIVVIVVVDSLITVITTLMNI
jgi:phospholipid/cholesterol/gamma-HCH transport system permease protein